MRILHSAENFAFWTLWRTKQGPTVVNQFEFRVHYKHQRALTDESGKLKGISPLS